MSDELPHVLPTQHLTPDIFRKIHNVFATGGLRKGQQQLEKLSPRGKEMFLDWWDENKDLLPPTDNGTDINALQSFSADVAEVINRHSMENPSGTPDFILGDLLTSVLASYNDAVQKRAEWRVETVELPAIERLVSAVEAETGKSHFQRVLDDIVSQQIQYRKNYAEFLMSNPGFIATYGDDFVVEYGEMTLSQVDKGEYNDATEYRVNFSQNVRFFTREAFSRYQQAHQTGLMREITDIRKRLQDAYDLGDEVAANHYQTMLERRADSLAEMGLRLDKHGNLESV